MKKNILFLKTLTILLVLNLSHVICYGLPAKQGQALIDSLMGQLPNARNDSAEIVLLHDISWSYQLINPDSGIKYGLLSLQLAQKLESPRGMAKAYNDLGSNYINKSDFQNALANFNKSLILFEQIKDKKHMGWVYGNMGNVCLHQSDFPKALEYYFKVLEIDEQLNDQKSQVTALGAIGIVYHTQSDYEKALEYYFKALKIAEQLGDKNSQATNLGNIGNVYKDEADYSNALKYYSNAETIAEAIGNKHSEAINLGNIGDLYYTQHNYSQALVYCYKGLKMCEQIGFKNGLGVFEQIVGSTYLHICKDSDVDLLNKYFSGDRELALQRAKSALDSSITILKKIKDLNHLKNAYLSYSETDKLLGDYKDALDNYEKYTTIKDSLFSNDTRKKIASLEKLRDEYVIQKKEAEEKRQRNIFMLGIALFIIAFITIVILLTKWRVHHTLVRILGVLGLLMMFEFMYLFIDPYITQWTNDNPIYTLSSMVGIAAIIVPTHHKLEHFLKENLAKRYSKLKHRLETKDGGSESIPKNED